MIAGNFALWSNVAMDDGTRPNGHEVGQFQHKARCRNVSLRSQKP